MIQLVSEMLAYEMRPNGRSEGALMLTLVACTKVANLRQSINGTING